ncbi:hypothetical protein GWI33_004676 [Rhynchophorus ferrugineus]|uniref:Uncharacterized protein n=1 Tax=Rhynchophorus ferrugineus TaxID=354439 RepID=A0A834IZ53_RHYFE|nr:hypothetical protein GWI33_004676 [Rhynchophorus ferrugineus]
MIPVTPVPRLGKSLLLPQHPLQNLLPKNKFFFTTEASLPAKTFTNIAPITTFLKGLGNSIGNIANLNIFDNKKMNKNYL